MHIYVCNSPCICISNFFSAKMNCQNVDYFQLNQHSLFPTSSLFLLALVFNSLSPLIQSLASQAIFSCVYPLWMMKVKQQNRNKAKYSPWPYNLNTFCVAVCRTFWTHVQLWKWYKECLINVSLDSRKTRLKMAVYSVSAELSLRVNKWDWRKYIAFLLQLALLLATLWRESLLSEKKKRKKKIWPYCSFSESHRPRNPQGRELAQDRIYGFFFPLAVKLWAIVTFWPLKSETSILNRVVASLSF